MNVQAFIDNISFPKSLEELDWFIDEFDVEQVLTVSETEWTAPKWTVKGDIVFFYHAKTAIQWISKLETKIKKERNRTEDNIFPNLFGEAFKKTMEESFQKDCDAQLDALQRGRKLYKKYGGKIFAIGQVSGRPIYDSQEGDEVLHWASRFMLQSIKFMCSKIQSISRNFRILFSFPVRAQSHQWSGMISRD